MPSSAVGRIIARGGVHPSKDAGAGRACSDVDVTPFARDAAAAAGYLVVGLALMLFVPDVRISWEAAPPPPGAAAVVVLVVACGALVLRRRAPLVGLGISVATFAAGIVLGATDLGVLLIFTDLLYCAVLFTSRRVSRSVSGAAGVAIVAVVVLSLVSGDGRAALYGLLNAALLLAIPVMWASEVRRHRTLADAERVRAEQAERMAALDREAAVAAERTRMARDLHDVVAGQLSAIALQSTAALNLPDADAPALRRVLGSVREQSVASLGEMRTMITLLRDGDDADPPAAPARLDDLAPLLDSARATGLDVTLDDSRHTAPARATVELATFRIITESLTNAAKHAPGSSVRVTLSDNESALVVEVANTPGGRPAGVGGGGTGLAGLRERAAAVGGTLRAGPTGDGWLVRAELPLEEPP